MNYLESTVTSLIIDKEIKDSKILLKVNVVAHDYTRRGGPSKCFTFFGPTPRQIMYAVTEFKAFNRSVAYVYPALIYESLKMPHKRVIFTIYTDGFTININRGRYGIRIGNDSNCQDRYISNLEYCTYLDEEFELLATSTLKEELPTLTNVPPLLNNIMLLRILRAGGDIDSSMFYFR